MAFKQATVTATGGAQTNTASALQVATQSGKGPHADSVQGSGGGETKGARLRMIHLQIDTPKLNGKTRAQRVKEALMLLFTTSKHLRLHPKIDGEGEIISNIDDFMTTEQFTKAYLFDARMAGTRNYKEHGRVDVYSTKVRIATDLTLSQMKWQTSPNFLKALQQQNIFLKEHRDGPPVRTGNIGWFTGLNPNQISLQHVQSELDRALTTIGVKAVVEPHTISIRFPEQKKTFVTKVMKARCDYELMTPIICTS